MSRMLVLSLAMMAGPATAQTAMPPQTLIDNLRNKISVVPHCRSIPGDTDIVVCGRRAADKWRVPYIGYAKGDPRSETVSGERNRLASEPPVKCGLGAQLRNCGSVGLSAGLNFGVNGPGTVRLRPLAP